MRSAAPPLLPVFRSQLQADLLAALLLSPEQEYSLTDLARRFKAPLSTVHGEVRRLSSAGLLCRRPAGRSTMVRANQRNRLVEPLAQLLFLSWGPLQVIAEEFSGLEDTERVVIFGSWAARYHQRPGKPPHDVDVLVIGQPSREDVYDAADRAQQRQRRVRRQDLPPAAAHPGQGAPTARAQHRRHPVGGRQAVATCDALLGQALVMIKPLGTLLAGADGYLGAAILGDGRIALIIEPSRLTRESRQHGTTAAPEPGSLLPAAPRILVVEDSFTVRELQRGILEAAGYPVVTARDGMEALDSLDRDPEIALVITDLQMPELDGIALTRAIRAHATRSSLPVIILTTLGSEDDRREGLEAGADAYMAKRSFDQQAMLATVERLVGRVKA